MGSYLAGADVRETKIMRLLLIPALAAALAPSLAAAQGVDVPTAPRQKVVTVFGQEACPRSTDKDEIVVCKREPYDNQFRIPAAVRAEARIEKRDDVGARIGLADHTMAPVNCTAVGTQGQFGCSQGLNILGAAKKVKDAVTGNVDVPDAPPN